MFIWKIRAQTKQKRKQNNHKFLFTQDLLLSVYNQEEKKIL